MNATNLTIVIPAANESANIERCVRSALALTDHVVVYCMGTDDTHKKAASLGAHVVTWAPRLSPFSDVQEAINHAIDACKTPWIMRIDADEEITPSLTTEIIQRLEHSPSNVVAYGVPRAQFFIKKFLYWGDWGYDRLIRLWQPPKARYENPGDTRVHEQLTVYGEVGCLKMRLNHYSHPSWAVLNEKFQSYTDLEAQTLRISQTEAVMKALILPPYITARWIIYHHGYRDGIWGIVAGFVRGWYDWLVYTKYLKMRNFPDHSTKSSVTYTEIK